MAARSPFAFSRVKALLTDTHATSLEAQLEGERQGISACAAHREGAEGVAAFLDKRPPDFMY